MHNHQTYSQARTWLFVPADKIDKVPKAFASGADQIIVDLEDAVAKKDKQQARDNLYHYDCQNESKPIWIRINQTQSQHFLSDIEMCQRLNKISGILLPKTESANDIKTSHHLTNLPIIGLIETAKGLHHLNDIAQAQGLLALSYGFLDICHELNVQPNTPSADIIANQIRYQLLLTSKVHQLVPPIDSVYPDFHDDLGLQQRVQLWSNMGMSGMLCIHPKQISTVHQSLIYDIKDIEFAHQVVNTYQQTGKAAFQIDGQMVDLPVIRKCEMLLQRLKDTK